MSLVESSLQAREVGHSSDTTATAPREGQSYTDLLDDKPEKAYTASHDDPYDETIYDDFYEMDDHQMMAPSPYKGQASTEAPVLPQKSALRASRLLDNVSLKLGSTFEAPETSRPIPHDLYLSSEEDVSSSADDSYDFDLDSSDESYTHSRRSSHEDTAKMVAVVFSGKPSIVDLSARRRSVSPASSDARERSSTFSSTVSSVDRPCTPSSSVSSLHQPSRKSSLLVEVMGKKKPPFLSIDPYANGSTYSLATQITDMTASPDETSPMTKQQPQPARTPTKDLFRGVTRTFSLVKKRSRPLMNTLAAAQGASFRPTTASPTPGSARPDSVVMEDPLAERVSSPMSPPVSYNDILEAARKCAQIMVPPSSASPTEPYPRSFSPVSSGTANPRRGILSGLAARRRSIKLTGKVA